MDKLSCKSGKDRTGGIGGLRREALRHQDFAAVQVHIGQGQAAAAQYMGAMAFAQGNDVHIGPVRRRSILLAHEAAHVVQQR